MSKWPWVSREQFEETKRQLYAVDKERLRLLDLLLGSGGRPDPNREPSGQQSAAPTPATVAIAEVDDGIRPVTEKPETQEMQNFTTPFDRTLARFDRAFTGGARPPAAFKARIH